MPSRICPRLRRRTADGFCLHIAVVVAGAVGRLPHPLVPLCSLYSVSCALCRRPPRQHPTPRLPVHSCSCPSAFILVLDQPPAILSYPCPPVAKSAQNLYATWAATHRFGGGFEGWHCVLAVSREPEWCSFGTGKRSRRVISSAMEEQLGCDPGRCSRARR